MNMYMYKWLTGERVWTIQGNLVSILASESHEDRYDSGSAASTCWLSLLYFPILGSHICRPKTHFGQLQPPAEFV